MHAWLVSYLDRRGKRLARLTDEVVDALHGLVRDDHLISVIVVAVAIDLDAAEGHGRAIQTDVVTVRALLGPRVGFFLIRNQVRSAVNSRYGRCAFRGGHRDGVLLLTLSLKALDVLHDEFLQSRFDHFGILCYVRQLIVVVVASEELLDGLTSERHEVLPELLIMKISPLFVDVLLIEVVLLGWNERGLNPLVHQIVPGEVLQPGVVLDLLSPRVTESILRFPLDHLQERK